jgi:hypothetical protein
MASSKKTLLHFIAWGRATGGSANKFIRTYPDYPPAVCFQLPQEITRLLQTESPLFLTNHVAIDRHIVLWLWKPVSSSRSKNICWYLGVQQHLYAADMLVRSFRMWQRVRSYGETEIVQPNNILSHCTILTFNLLTVLVYNLFGRKTYTLSNCKIGSHLKT